MRDNNQNQNPREFSQENIDAGSRLHPFAADEIAEVKRRMAHMEQTNRGAEGNTAKYIAECQVQGAAAQTFASDLMPLSDLENYDLNVLKNQNSSYDIGTFAIPAEMADRDDLEEVSETFYKNHILKTLAAELRSVGTINAETRKKKPSSEKFRTSQFEVLFVPPVIQKVGDQLLARFPSGYPASSTSKGLEYAAKAAEASLVPPEQLKLSDQEVATLLNDFKAAAELQFTASGSTETYDFNQTGQYFAELMKTRPNLSLDHSGLIIVTEEGKKNSAAAGAAHMEYAMTKEHIAKLAKTEMGASEPLSEGQVRNELAKEKKRRTEAEKETEVVGEAVRTERITKQSQIDRLGGELAKKNIDLSTETTRATKAEQERDALKEKLAQIEAILKSAGTFNKGSKIDEVLALLK